METNGVDGVFQLGFYFWNLSEIEKSYVECTWRVPMKVKAYFMYRRCCLVKDFLVQTHAASFTLRLNQFSSDQDGYIIEINYMSTRNYVLEDCSVISIVTTSTVFYRMTL